MVGAIDPFLLFNESHGVSALRTDTEYTPLQIKLNILAVLIVKVGSIAGECRRSEPEQLCALRTQDFSIDQSKLNTVLPPQLHDLFNAAIAINSTVFKGEDPATNEVVFIGSKMETAPLNFAKELKLAHYRPMRDTAEVAEMIPFSSERKAVAVVVKLANVNHRLYVKGASKILTTPCSRHVVVSPAPNQEDDTAIVVTAEIDANSRENTSRTIIFYANQTLRTIAVCYRDFVTWPPPHMPYEALARELILIGIVGIEDPLCEGVREAVADCQKAGVAVKMCTADNVLTTRSIASQCGIFMAGGITMEGPIFRQLNDKDMLDIVPWVKSSAIFLRARATQGNQILLLTAIAGDPTE
ncbi:putative calcium ATPase [Melanogaster broomeanus]|nr:putative calcium ATPase [Melanogaster broomeanus]